ncbi:hypothetical protein FFF34_009050 [Inquilinus sp. KBS0705]|nr:hypothetical protein FFF34_009050 [Inquilinus sp. KBS0705]
MKKLIFIALLLIVSIKSIAQGGNDNISQRDSIELIKAWNVFKKELFSKDINALKLLSSKIVSGKCMLMPIDPNCNSLTSPDKLLGLFFKEMFPSCRRIILTDKYHLAVYSSIKDKDMKIKYPTQFQIWFTSKSEPGYQFAFIFEKIAGKFKFSGLDRMP